MRLISELPGPGRRLMDVVLRIALLLLMAGVAIHAAATDAPVRGTDPVTQQPG